MHGLIFFAISPVIYAQSCIQEFAPKPPSGFNSFDSCRTHLSQDKVYALMDVTAEQYPPFGYKHFVIDPDRSCNVEFSLNKQDSGFVALEASCNLTVARQHFRLKDIWSDETITIEDKHTFNLPAEGVVFLKFQMQ